MKVLSKTWCHLSGHVSYIFNLTFGTPVYHYNNLIVSWSTYVDFPLKIEVVGTYLNYWICIWYA